jgi:hypothetical protein
MGRVNRMHLNWRRGLFRCLVVEASPRSLGRILAQNVSRRRGHGRSFGRGRPLKVPAESSVPTADDFRAVYSVAERFVPPEDIVRQPPRIVRTSCTGRFIRVWVIQRQQANITLKAAYIPAASPGNALLVSWIAGRLTGNYGPKHSFSEAKERVSANAGPFVFWAAVSSPVTPHA